MKPQNQDDPLKGIRQEVATKQNERSQGLFPPPAETPDKPTLDEPTESDESLDMSNITYGKSKRGQWDSPMGNK